MSGLSVGMYEPFEGRNCFRPMVPPCPKLEDVWVLLDQAMGGGTFSSLNIAIGRLAEIGIVQLDSVVGQERMFMAPDVIGIFKT